MEASSGGRGRRKQYRKGAFSNRQERLTNFRQMKEPKNNCWSREGRHFQRNNHADAVGQKREKLVLHDIETYEYFERVSERLEIGFDDDNEKAVFMTNVVEKAKSKEVELSCNRLTSHTLQTLLDVCEDSVVMMKFAEAFSSSLRQICTNQYGSHVIESLLSCGMKILKKYEGTNNHCQEEEISNPYVDVTSWILKFSKFCLNNLNHFLGHVYASHVLRALVEVWSGMKMEQSVRKSKKSIMQRRKFQNPEENSGLMQFSEPSESTKFQVPEEFISHLKEFYRKIIERNNLTDCCTDSTVSPILQTLLVGLQERIPKLCQKFIKLLMKNVMTWKDEEKIPIAMTDKSSSCVVEKVILTADEKRQKWMWKHCFKNCMKPLVVHPIACFIVQTLFSAFKGKEQFEDAFNEVMPYFEEIIETGHNGIIVSIAEGCVRLGTCQAVFMQVIMKTLQCLEPEQRQLYLCPLAIQLSQYSAFEERSKISENSLLFSDMPLSLHGSLLLQKMMKFHKPVKVVRSLLFMKNDLKLIACDPKGSHVIESFLTSAYVGEKNREKLLIILKPYLLFLACDKFGSRVLDSLWATGSLKQRTLISQELLSNEAELNASVYGRYFNRKCGLFYFKTRFNDWKQVQTIETKKRKLFNGILS